MTLTRPRAGLPIPAFEIPIPRSRPIPSAPFSPSDLSRRSLCLSASRRKNLLAGGDTRLYCTVRSTPRGYDATDYRDRLDLARRRVHSLGRRAGPRALPLAPVRVVRLRRHPLLLHSARTGNLSARGSPPAARRFVQDLSDGAPVVGGRARGRVLRARRAQ